jgi:hypothetical protein
MGFALIVLLALGFLVATTRSRATLWVAGATGACLAALCLYPQLILGDRDRFHVGMAPPTLELRTFTFVVGALALGALVPFRRHVFPMAWIPFGLWLAFGMVTFWDGSPEQWSGVAQFAIGIAGWVAGSFLGRWTDRDRRTGAWMAMTIAGIIAIQFVVTLAQRAGVGINGLDPQDAAILGDRVNGTMNHPNNLGKAIFLLTMLLLPLTRSADRRTKKLAVRTVLVAMVPLGLAQGRANFISIALLFIVWALLLPDASSRRAKPLIIAGAVLALIGFGIAFSSRFVEDPGGGVRTELTGIALEQIDRAPLTGLGPNSYTIALGPQTGSYIPVHNTFLLLAAEVGLVGMVLFLLPFARVTGAAWRRRSRPGPSGDYARVLVASVPGIVLIGATGWGMLGSSILALWTFTTAFCAVNLVPSPPPAAARATSAGATSALPPTSVLEARGQGQDTAR